MAGLEPAIHVLLLRARQEGEGHGSGTARPALPGSSPEPVRLGEALGRQPSGFGAVGDPVPQVLLGNCPGAARCVDPGQAFLQLEDLGVGHPAVLVALEPHALAAAHFRHLLQRKDQQLAILADDCDVVTLRLGADDRLVGRIQGQHALALRVFATVSSAGATNPRPSLPTTRSFAPGRYAKAAMKSAPSSRSTIRRIGSPKPRPPGSLDASSVKKRPLSAATTILDVVSAKKAVFKASSPLNCTPDRSAWWP